FITTLYCYMYAPPIAILFCAHMHLPSTSPARWRFSRLLHAHSQPHTANLRIHTANTRVLTQSSKAILPMMLFARHWLRARNPSRTGLGQDAPAPLFCNPRSSYKLFQFPCRQKRDIALLYRHGEIL